MIARRMFNFPGRTIWRDPFFEMDAFKRELDGWTNFFNGRRTFRSLPSGVFPSLNITEDQNNYFIRAELPGIKSDEIDIQLNGRTLSLAGERKCENCDAGAKFHRKERDTGKFSRSVMLPGEVDAEKVSANMINGILTVTVGKAEVAKARKISVN